MNILLALIGFSSGFAVAGGVFALITILGIIPRLCDRLGLASHTYLAETMIVLGGSLGSLFTVYKTPLPLGILTGTVLLAVFGIYAGIFIGSLAMALAESLKVIPILSQRTKFKHGIAVIILAIALGKGFGCLYQLFLMGGK